MKINLFSSLAFLFLFTNPVYSQVLSTDEKVEILGLGAQSIDIINFAAIGDYTKPQLDQASQMKKIGIQDKNLILVLTSNAKFTYDEILRLKEYQTKGYSEIIIQKSIDEKPKFQSEPEKKQEAAIELENKKPNNDINNQVPKDPSTGKIIYEDTVQVPRVSDFTLNRKAIIWMNNHLAPKEIVESLNSTAFRAKGQLVLDKDFVKRNEQWMVDQSITFIVKFKCKEGQYTYQITDFVHSLIPGKTKTNKEIESNLAKSVEDEIRKEMDKLIVDLKTTIKPVNNDW